MEALHIDSGEWPAEIEDEFRASMDAEAEQWTAAMVKQLARKPQREADSLPTDPPEPQRDSRRVVARVVIQGENGAICCLHEDDTGQYEGAGVRLGLPGGGVEQDESCRDAAVREAQEEAGLAVQIACWLCDMDDVHTQRRYYVAGLAAKQREAEFDPAKHPRAAAGSPEGGEFTSGGGSGGHEGMQKSLVNPLDGGIGPSIQFHGTAAKTLDQFGSDPIYITDLPYEAMGYAKGLHLGGSTGGKPRVLTVRRAPGATKNIDAAVQDAVMNGDDPEKEINDLLQGAKVDGYRYAYFEHPSFEDDKLQRVLVSLFPSEDLRILKPKRRESLHLDADGGHIVDVLWLPQAEALAQLTSPFDKAAVALCGGTTAQREAVAKPALYHGPLLDMPQGLTARADAVRARYVPPAIASLVHRVTLADLGAVHGEYGNGIITLNPKIFTSKERFGTGANRIDRLTHTLVHEYAHALGGTGHDTNPQWLALSGWQNNPGKTPKGTARYVEERPGWEPGPSAWVHAADAWMVRNYSSRSPAEDFADCGLWVLLGGLDKFNGGGEAKRQYVQQAIVDAARGAG